MKPKAISLVILTLQCGLMANPSNPQVSSGDVSFDASTSGVLNIQASDRAIINWQDFSIDAGELTAFYQPDASSAVLNRVTGGNISSIMGTLKANGKVYLINPSGVIFGENSVIDTGALVASSLDLPDQLFLQNGDLLFSGDSNGLIANYGAITASNGDVILIGYQVDNHGTIDAEKGVAALGAGKEILIRPLAQERMYVRVSVTDQADGTALNNSGSIFSLQAELKADGNAFSKAINHSGMIDAAGIVEQGGKVFLVAEQGNVEVSGAVVVLGSEDNGGDVDVLAKNIFLTPESIIDADASCNGNGGTVMVLGDNGTHFYGKITAEGGTFSGDGGFIEISAPDLIFEGEVSTLAPNGVTGMLTLDPNEIIVTNANPTTGFFNGFFYEGAGSCTAYLNIDDLKTALASSNVTIRSDDELACGNPGAGNITFKFDPMASGSKTVTWSSLFGLSVYAANDINVYTQIINNSVSTTPSPENIVLNAGHDLNVGNAGMSPPASLAAPCQVGSLSGDLVISVGNDLNVVGGGSSVPAQIGMQGVVGMTDDFDVNSNIYVDFVGGNLNVAGGTAVGSYAAIGHGDISNDSGNIFGNVTINTIRGSVNVSGGSAVDAYAQVGHRPGTLNTPTVTSGDVSLPSIGSIVTLAGGSAASAYGLIGHGSDSIDTVTQDISGNIAVNAIGFITLNGGTDTATFAAIGFTNGMAADSAVVDVSGSVDVLTNENLIMTANSGLNSNAMIGAFFGNTAASEISPDTISVTVGGNATLVSDMMQEDSFAAIGAWNSDGQISNTNLFVNIGHAGFGLMPIPSLSMTAEAGPVFIVNGSGTQPPFSISDLNLICIQKLNMTAGNNSLANVFIESVGTADIYVKEGSLTLTSSDATAFIQIADFGDVYAGSFMTLNSSDTFFSNIVSTSGDLSLTAGIDLTVGPNSYVQAPLGSLSMNAGGNIEIDGFTVMTPVPYPVDSNDSLELVSGGNIYIYGATIEHTGSFMTVSAGRDLDIGLNASSNPAIRPSILGQRLGEVFVTAGHDINVIGGGGTNPGALSLLGSSDPTATGIDCTMEILFVGNDINVSGGAALGTPGQIGGISTNFINDSGLLIDYVGGDVTVEGGTVSSTLPLPGAQPSYGQIGFYSPGGGSIARSTVVLSFVGGNVFVNGSSTVGAQGAYAQIGLQSNTIASGGVTLDLIGKGVTVQDQSNPLMPSGADLNNFALIGCRGDFLISDISAVNITGSFTELSNVQEGVSVNGGSGDLAFGLIGFGREAIPMGEIDTYSGFFGRFVNVFAQSVVTVNGGTGTRSFAAIGYADTIYGTGAVAGFGAVKISNAAVDVTSQLAVAAQGGSGNFSHALIGAFTGATDPATNIVLKGSMGAPGVTVTPENGFPINDAITFIDLSASSNVNSQTAVGAFGTNGTISTDVNIIAGSSFSMDGSSGMGLVRVLNGFGSPPLPFISIYGGTGVSMVATTASVEVNSQGPLTVIANENDIFIQSSSAAVVDIFSQNNTLFSAANDITMNGGFIQCSPSALLMTSPQMVFFATTGDISIGAEDATDFSVVELDSILGQTSELHLSAGRDFNVIGGFAVGSSSSFGDTVGPGTMNIFIDNVGRDVNVTGGSAMGGAINCQAQIGQFTDTTVFGSITFTKVGRNVNVTAGKNGDGCYALIGQQTLDTGSDILGNMTFVSIGGDVNVFGTGGSGTAPTTGFAQIGPYSTDNLGDIGNNILGGMTFSSIGGGVNVAGGFGLGARAHIGPAGGTIGNPIFFYEILLSKVSNSVTITGGTGQGSSAQLGQFAANDLFGDVTLDAVGVDVDITGVGNNSLGIGCSGQIGQYSVNGDVIGDVTLNTVGNEINLMSGVSVSAFAQLGPFSGGTAETDIFINQTGGSVSVTAGNGGDFCYALIGPYSQSDNTGGIHFGLVGGDVNVTGTGGSSLTSFSRIGPKSVNGTTFATSLIGGMEFETIKGSVNVTGGFGLSVQAHIGPRGITVGDPSLNYDIAFGTVEESVNVTGGMGTNSFALIGQIANMNLWGDITFDTVAVDVNVIGMGGGSLASICFAQIGQFSVVTGNSIGDITFNSIGNNVNILGGMGQGGYGKIGARVVNGNATGDMLFDAVGGNVRITAGTNYNTFGQIGHYASGAVTSDMHFNSIGGRMIATGGGNIGSDFCFAQVGHLAGANIVGDMFFPYIGIDFNLLGGVGSGGYAQCGHKTTGVASTITSIITITEIGQDLGMFAGSANYTYVQLGSMAPTGGNINCPITLVSIGNNLSLIAAQTNPPIDAFAQIGSRGATTLPSGLVTIGAIGDTSKIISGPGSNYAIPGNKMGTFINP